MAIQTRLPLGHPDALEINGDLDFIEQGTQATYFACGVPLFIHDQSDEPARRLAAMQILELRLAKKKELSAAFGVDRTTLYRQQLRFREGGVAAVVGKQRGPKGAHKLIEAALSRAQGMLNSGGSQQEAAHEAGVSVKTIQRAIGDGKLTSWKAVRASRVAELEGSQPGERNAQDAAAPLGVATTRVTERALAATGKIEEAAPEFKTSLSVANAGALLALPAMLELGLLEVGENVYGSLRNGFYGLRSTLLCLGFMALLRIRNPERMQFEAPGELGMLLGLDRAPETKTIRRKLTELVERGQANRLSAGLAERWVRQTPRALGYLYVDGHVRAYNGEKHRLTKTHVARRRLCMPATTDYWVNDKNAEPVFFVTGEVNERLIATMKTTILPEVRRLAGKKRRVTMVFDREGWSPKWFQELYAAGFDVLTYRKGTYDMWPRSAFDVVEECVEGREVSYELAEKMVRVLPGFKMREIRRLRMGGRQTAIVTTRWKTRAVELAWRMFARWRQENFFRYMREHFVLDAMASRRIEPVSGRTIPNPKCAKLEKKLAKFKSELQKLEKDYGVRAFENDESLRPTARGFKIANGKLGREIRTVRSKCQRLKERISSLPKRIATTDAEGPQIVKLDPETKHLTDTIKMLAYRAETVLVELLNDKVYARTEEEGRALVREILRSPADVLPDERESVLRVRLHGLANQRSNAAVSHLCEILNEAEITYPGTGLRMRYEATNVASIRTTCQES